jgi:Baseplate J-like protein
MPLIIPTLDDRKYQDLLDEALARIPVHNPEWTNFNKSDPGVTLLEVFAFLTENLLYRANQIPERNRLKFLTLLGVPLRPASSARGLVAFTNERGPRETFTLNTGLEVRAGQIPFRTEQSLDVLPIEAQVYYKRKVEDTSGELTNYYKQLYASFMEEPGSAPLLYETVAFSPRGTTAIDLGQETIDGSLWIALLLRTPDKPAGGASPPNALDEVKDEVREKIAGKVLNLGIVPELEDAASKLEPTGRANPEGATLLKYEMPKIPAGGGLPTNPSDRVPQYRALEAGSTTDVLAQPGVVQINLPSKSELALWNNLDPLEPGTGDFPPALDDTTLNDRVITWLRVRSSAAVQARLLWAGINVVHVTQRAHVSNEILPNGTGAPDQVVVLSKTPVIPGSVGVTVTPKNGKPEKWQETSDLMSAGPEVPAPDLRQPPGTPPVTNPLVKVFAVNAESGEIRFGDGTHGARPPFGATLRADYDYGVGAAGNVGAGSINTSPALPAGIKVTNPVRTWGGAEAETTSEGEKQITRYLQHRDRLVNAEDFVTITRRTPGVNIARVDVIPAFNPELVPNEPGDAPGAVTLMIIPRYDTAQPDAPRPDALLLNTICAYLDSRRLVTTEVFLRGPTYKLIWLSVGINVVAGASVPEVRERVKQELLRFLSPLPAEVLDEGEAPSEFLCTQEYAERDQGWPLRKPVVSLELLAVASRVRDVKLVNNVLLAEGTASASQQVNMSGLELPRVGGISVSIGDAQSLDELRGQATPTTAAATLSFVPVPVIPEECK